MFGNIRDQMARKNIPAMPGDISGYGGGTFNVDGSQATPVQSPQGGMFGRPKRKTSQRVAGYIADALAGLAGQQGPYGMMLADENAQAEQEAAYQRQRADEYADWQKRQEYEAAHATPRVNDTEADYNFWKAKLSPEDFERWQRNRVDPIRYAQGADGQFYPLQTAQTPPARPVGRLTPLEGGPASQAPGGFP